MCTKTVSGRPVWSCSESNTDETWSANRTAMWTLSTDGQSTAARSLPAGEVVSSDHSRTRSGLKIVAVDVSSQFGEPCADISTDGPEPYYKHCILMNESSTSQNVDMAKCSSRRWLLGRDPALP